MLKEWKLSPEVEARIEAEYEEWRQRHAKEKHCYDDFLLHFEQLKSQERKADDR